MTLLRPAIAAYGLASRLLDHAWRAARWTLTRIWRWELWCPASAASLTFQAITGVQHPAYTAIVGALWAMCCWSNSYVARSARRHAAFWEDLYNRAEAHNEQLRAELSEAKDTLVAHRIHLPPRRAAWAATPAHPSGACCPACPAAPRTSP